MKSPSWPTACSDCNMGYLDSSGKWSMADGRPDATTSTRGFICEFKGPVCPVGYVWLYDSCIGVARNKVASGERSHANCRMGGAVQNVYLATLNRNEVLSKRVPYSIYLIYEIYKNRVIFFFSFAVMFSWPLLKARVAKIRFFIPPPRIPPSLMVK